MSSRKVETERVVRWTVWKRYSEFESLDKAMRADFGWQIEAKAKVSRRGPVRRGGYHKHSNI